MADPQQSEGETLASGYDQGSFAASRLQAYKNEIYTRALRSEAALERAENQTLATEDMGRIEELISGPPDAGTVPKTLTMQDYQRAFRTTAPPGWFGRDDAPKDQRFELFRLTLDTAITLILIFLIFVVGVYIWVYLLL